MDILYYCGDEIPKGTQYLHSRIKLTKEIPSFPEGLLEIVLHGTGLTKIPSLPKSVRHLDLDNNPLIELPPLHEGLTFLSVNNTNLARLPQLPQSLLKLRCNDNPNLRRLPELPDGLQELEWLNRSGNALPLLPRGMTLLKSQYNKKTNQPIRLGSKEIRTLRNVQDNTTEKKIAMFQRNMHARRIQHAWDNYWYRPNEEGESRAAKRGYRRLTQDM